MLTVTTKIQEEIYYPQYYGEDRMTVYAPRRYLNTNLHHRMKVSDEYSTKIYYHKTGEDKTQYFSPYLCELGRKLVAEGKIPKPEVVTVMPSSHTRGVHLTLDGSGKNVAIALGVRFMYLLKRIKEINKSTSIITRDARFQNVSGSLQADNLTWIKSANILVIDDVKTTGISIMEAQKVLRSAGAKSVSVIVLGING